MRKTTYQRVTTKRIQEAAPELKYVALYHRDEERLARSYFYLRCRYTLKHIIERRFVCNLAEA